MYWFKMYKITVAFSYIFVRSHSPGQPIFLKMVDEILGKKKKKVGGGGITSMKSEFPSSPSLNIKFF